MELVIRFPVSFPVTSPAPGPQPGSPRHSPGWHGPTRAPCTARAGGLASPGTEAPFWLGHRPQNRETVLWGLVLHHRQRWKAWIWTWRERRVLQPNHVQGVRTANIPGSVPGGWQAGASWQRECQLHTLVTVFIKLTADYKLQSVLFTVRGHQHRLALFWEGHLRAPFSSMNTHMGLWAKGIMGHRSELVFHHHGPQKEAPWKGRVWDLIFICFRFYLIWKCLEYLWQTHGGHR